MTYRLPDPHEYGGHRLPGPQAPSVSLGAAAYQEVLQQMLAKGMADGLKLAIVETRKAENQQELMDSLKKLLKLAEDRDLRTLNEKLKGIQDKTWKTT